MTTPGLLLHVAESTAHHGVEPAAFVSVLVAGMAIMAAVAALVFTRRRPPL